MVWSPWRSHVLLPREADQFIGTAPSPLLLVAWRCCYCNEAGLKVADLSAATTQQVQAFVRHQLSNYVQVQMGVDEGPH